MPGQGLCIKLIWWNSWILVNSACKLVRISRIIRNIRFDLRRSSYKFEDSKNPNRAIRSPNSLDFTSTEHRAILNNLFRKKMYWQHCQISRGLFIITLVDIFKFSWRICYSIQYRIELRYVRLGCCIVPVCAVNRVDDKNLYAIAVRIIAYPCICVYVRLCIFVCAFVCIVLLCECVRAYCALIFRIQLIIIIIIPFDGDIRRDNPIVGLFKIIYFPNTETYKCIIRIQQISIGA